MKLIMESWRQSIDEMNAAAAGGVQGTAAAKEELNEEELDEGMKDMFIAALMALGLPSVASAGGIDHPYNPDMQHSQEIVQDAAQILANAAKKGDPDMKAAADALQKVADSPEDVQDSAAKFGLSDQAIEFADYALKKVSEKHSQSDAGPAADSGIEGDTNNDGKLSPLELQRLQQSKSNLTQKQKDDAITGMKKIQQQRNIKEEKATAHNIVRRMKKDSVDALTALMSFGMDKQEASKWLKANTQDINRAKRELGLRESAI